AGIPLVESGTAGYLGQATVIKGGQTECFDCQPKPVEQKTYPVCTIRSTPTAPIHCIVWAKNYLFAQLFGEKSGAEADLSAEENEENMEELRLLREESKALARLAEAMNSPSFAQQVFQKVFGDDIERLLSMKDMWKHRRPPTRLDLDKLEANTRSDFDPATHDDQSVLSLEDSYALFKYTADKLAQRMLGQRNPDGGSNASGQRQASLSFDKDDQDTLGFVAATANLRSYAFGIEPKSTFAIKAMAGNIIPAIATTNAIVAGMMVVQAILVLSKRLGECHTTYLSYNSKRSRSLLTEPLSKPNPRCPVCRRRYLILRLGDPAKTTLGDVVNHVHGMAASGQDLALGEDISVVEGARILYDPDFDDNLAETLEGLGLVPGKMITLASEDDDSVVPVILCVAKSQNSDGNAISIEGFENIPEFAPLPPTDTDQDKGESADDKAVGSDARNPTNPADDGTIILDDDSNDDKNVEANIDAAK
ncbi:E1 ubiquitin-activating protein uba2, partial [Dipsacomyces acuminosporus]